MTDQALQVIEQHAVLILLASVFSFGVTEIVKPFMSLLVDGRERRRALTRLCAILSGAIVGYTLGPTWLDLWFGAGAGTLNAWLVALIKEKIEKRIGVIPDQTPPPSKPGKKPEELDDEQR